MIENKQSPATTDGQAPGLSVPPGSPLSFDEFWRDPIPSTTPRTDAAKHNYIKQALPETNVFEPMREMEREITALKKRITLADATVVACHSAMLGKVNPKHPAWGCVYAYEDQANVVDVGRAGNGAPLATQPHPNP